MRLQKRTENFFKKKWRTRSRSTSMHMENTDTTITMESMDTIMENTDTIMESMDITTTTKIGSRSPKNGFQCLTHKIGTTTRSLRKLSTTSASLKTLSLRTLEQALDTSPLASQSEYFPFFDASFNFIFLLIFIFPNKGRFQREKFTRVTHSRRW